MKQFKKRTLVLGGVILGGLIVSGLVALAYFSDINDRENTVTIADNIIEISEDYQPPVQQQAGDNIYKKEVTVTNRGKTPVYIRVYADFSDGAIRSRSFLSNDDACGENTFYSAERSSQGETYIAKLSQVAPGWVFEPMDAATPLSGFFYYTIPLEGGESAPPLFTWVKTINTSEQDIQQYLNDEVK